MTQSPQGVGVFRDYTLSVSSSSLQGPDGNPLDLDQFLQDCTAAVDSGEPMPFTVNDHYLPDSGSRTFSLQVLHVTPDGVGASCKILMGAEGVTWYVAGRLAGDAEAREFILFRHMLRSGPVSSKYKGEVPLNCVTLRIMTPGSLSL